MKRTTAVLWLASVAAQVFAATDDASRAALETEGGALGSLATILGVACACALGVRAWASDGPGLGVAGAAVGFALGAAVGSLLSFLF